jgi:hypothetical protein
VDASARCDRSGSALVDPTRGAQVVARTPLVYARGANADLDRPAHVRAGSALVALDDGRLAVIQDDAAFLAVIDPATRAAHDIAFPSDDGDRQFDDGRGNKEHKLDLEAAFLVHGAGTNALLVALGSGSSALRERIVLVDRPATTTPVVTIVEAPELYATLRAERAFSGSELNVEGAIVVGADVLLFQRGNGAPSSSHRPVDATARIALTPLLAYLRGEGPSPPLRDVIAWDLGGPNGKRLTFTDGALSARGRVAFLACAEDSPDATRDGPVSAVALGCLDEAGRTAELGFIRDEHGALLLDKTEGLVFDPANPERAFVVTDRDDPDAPSELLELRLGAAWTR